MGVIFFPDGKLAIVAVGDRILLYEMKEVFTFIKSIPGHTSFIYALAFSKDSTKFASGR